MTVRSKGHWSAFCQWSWATLGLTAVINKLRFAAAFLGSFCHSVLHKHPQQQHISQSSTRGAEFNQGSSSTSGMEMGFVIGIRLYTTVAELRQSSSGRTLVGGSEKSHQLVTLKAHEGELFGRWPEVAVGQQGRQWGRKAGCEAEEKKQVGMCEGKLYLSFTASDSGDVADLGKSECLSLWSHVLGPGLGGADWRDGAGAEVAAQPAAAAS